ncbi:hypothetical protein KCU93_g5800, partial [Aureobasidium melanogenum]
MTDRPPDSTEPPSGGLGPTAASRPRRSTRATNVTARLQAAYQSPINPPTTRSRQTTSTSQRSSRVPRASIATTARALQSQDDDSSSAEENIDVIPRSSQEQPSGALQAPSSSVQENIGMLDPSPDDASYVPPTVSQTPTATRQGVSNRDLSIVSDRVTWLASLGNVLADAPASASPVAIPVVSAVGASSGDESEDAAFKNYFRARRADRLAKDAAAASTAAAIAIPPEPSSSASEAGHIPEDDAAAAAATAIQPEPQSPDSDFVEFTNHFRKRYNDRVAAESARTGSPPRRRLPLLSTATQESGVTPSVSQGLAGSSEASSPIRAGPRRPATRRGGTRRAAPRRAASRRQAATSGSEGSADNGSHSSEGSAPEDGSADGSNAAGSEESADDEADAPPSSPPTDEDGVLRAMQNDFRKIKNTFDVASNPNLHYADKLRRYLADSSLLRRVAPYQHAEQGRLLTELLELPILPGTDGWQANVMGGKRQDAYTKGWQMVFRKGLIKDRVRFQTYIPSALVPLDDPQATANCMAIANRVIDIVRRFAFVDLDGSTGALLIRSVGHALFDKPNLVMQPNWVSKKGLMRLAVRRIDPDTRKFASKSLSFSPSPFEDVDIDDIPDVDRLCRFTTGRNDDLVDQETTADGSLITPSVLPNAAINQYGDNVLKLEKFARFVSYQMSDLVVSEAGLDQMINDELHDLGAGGKKGSKRKKRSYGGSVLMYGERDSKLRCVFYRFGRTVLKDLGDLPSAADIRLASVRTLNGVLASIPLDVGLKYYRSTGDPRIGALYLAEAADYVNAEVILQQVDSSDCGCDSKMSCERYHHCQSCLDERVCNSLVAYLGARICKRCRNKLETGGLPTAVKPVMDASIRRNHVAECKALGKDSQAQNEQTRLQHMIDMFDDHYGTNNDYRDDYSSMSRTVEGIDTVRAHRDPFICSVDATEPYGESHDKTMRVHTAANVAISTSGYNYIKQRQLIAFLDELARYDPAIPHTPQQKREFTAICNDLYLVAAKTPFTKKARLKGRGIDDLKADQAEWRRGKPTDEEGPWNPALWRWSHRAVPQAPRSSWNRETRRRLGRLSDQIQRHFGVTLKKAADGSPYIIREGDDSQVMPEGWSWAHWSLLMDERLERMRTFCNRHGITIDSSEGLFAELIWQICTNDPDYHEFFDLPLNIYHRHPLCFSVGHRKHGQSMATGWPLHPSDLSDRDDDANNILFETWTSNVAKMDMDEESCRKLRGDIKNVRLARSELYNKDTEVQQRSTSIKFEALTQADIDFESLYTSVEVMDEDEDEGMNEDDSDYQEGEDEDQEEGDEDEDDGGDQEEGDEDDEMEE